jgi:hypothetical protein
MKSIPSLIFLSIIIPISVFSQSYTERIVIPAGNNAWQNFLKHVYMYPEFTMGTITYKDGQTFTRLLNFHKAIGTVLFIENKDTMLMTKEQNVQSITIGNDLYFYNPECQQTSNSTDKVKLVKNERIRIADQQKVGAFGTRTVSGTIESIDRGAFNNADYQWDVNQVLLLRKVVKFYIQKDGKETLPATKRNILSLFPQKEDDVKQFINQNNISFNNDKDLTKLAAYLSKL